MNITKKTLKTGIGVALLLTGMAAGARGQIANGEGAFGVGGNMMVQIKGKVLCAACSLEEVRKAQPRESHLYQLSSRQGRVVLKVDWVSNSARWHRVVWPPRLWARGEERMLQQLGTEENLFKDVEITGILGNSRTLDVYTVTITG
jgi:hypothetical protein